MVKNKSKKLISAIAALALSATTAFGVAAAVRNNGVNKAIPQMPAAAFAQTVTGDVYYVSADVDPGVDGEVNNPAKPFQFTNLVGQGSKLKPGDVVVVPTGDFNTDQKIDILCNGTYNAYITFVNASCWDAATKTISEEPPEQSATLKFYEQQFDSSNRGVRIIGDYIRWYGIDIAGAGDNGMLINGSYNIVEYCQFYDNRDTGLQLARFEEAQTNVKDWPHYNLIKNCTSFNNYDNETYGENADGFAAKLTVGYGNVFDGCIAYRNSDDGWDLFAKPESGSIGAVILYNCVAFENGFIAEPQATFNAKFSKFNSEKAEQKTDKDAYGDEKYTTRDGDGNGFKLGGSTMVGDVVVVNSLTFHNRMHGVTDNSNPGVIHIEGITSYDNGRDVQNDKNAANYGQILATGSDTDSGHGNVDLARQLYSYNNIIDTLSVKSSSVTGLSADAYRASVRNSLLGTGTKSNVDKAHLIDGKLDCNTKGDVDRVDNSGNPVYINITTGTSDVDAPAPEAVFEQLPVTWASEPASIGYVFSGKANTTVHQTCRNDDGSINMGNILKIKSDFTYNQIGEENIGARLSETNYEAYPHFKMDNKFTGDIANAEAAVLDVAKKVVTIATDLDATYQNFPVPCLMENCTIEWESADPTVLEVGTDQIISFSQTVYKTIIVHRQADADKTVKLTAHISVNNSTVTGDVDFNVTVIKADPRVGQVTVVTSKGQTVKDGESIIIDQHTVMTEPEVVVYDASNYNGLVLDKDLYDLETEYQFAPSATRTFSVVKGFTPSAAGVFKITHTATLKADPTNVRTMSYSIYPASTTDENDFGNDVSVTVNRGGFAITGTPGIAKGALYAVSVADKDAADAINVTNIKEAAGVQRYDYEASYLENIPFTQANSSAYYVCFALANTHGDITHVHQAQIYVQNITTAEEFMDVAKGSESADDTSASTIYLLTGDIDFSGKTVNASGSFKALLNGNGHTISNITTTSKGVFSKVEGGTIMNLKVDKLNINCSEQKVGFVSICTGTGGTFYNIQMTNVNIRGGQRTGGLIGAIENGIVNIEKVSLTNPLGATSFDENGYYIASDTAARVGGLVGFSQANSGLSSGAIKIYFKDCYVVSDVTAKGDVGGLFALYDAGNNANCEYLLQMDHCYYQGEVRTLDNSNNKLGGMLGNQKGSTETAIIDIRNCVSLAVLNYRGEVLTSCVKNGSGIVGAYVVGSQGVYDCIALMDEHNSDFGVTAYIIDNVKAETFTGLGFTGETWSAVENGALRSPFIKLNFAG